MLIFFLAVLLIYNAATVPELTLYRNYFSDAKLVFY